MYDLKSSKAAMEKKLSDLMDILPQTHDLFDLATVKTLLQFVLPLKLNDDAGLRMKEGESLHLWPAFEKILSPHISNLSQSIIARRHIVRSIKRHARNVLLRSKLKLYSNCLRERSTATFATVVI